MAGVAALPQKATRRGVMAVDALDLEIGDGEFFAPLRPSRCEVEGRRRRHADFFRALAELA